MLLSCHLLLTFFEAFAKVSVNFGIFANAINQPFTPYFVVSLMKIQASSCFYHFPALMNRKWENVLLIMKKSITFPALSLC